MIRIVRFELRAPKADIGEAWSNRRKQLRYVKRAAESALGGVVGYAYFARVSANLLNHAHATRVGAALDLAGLDN